MDNLTEEINRAHVGLATCRSAHETACHNVTQAERAYSNAITHTLARRDLTMEQAWKVMECVGRHKESVDTFTQAMRAFGDLLRLEYPFIWKVAVGYGSLGITAEAYGTDTLIVGSLARLLDSLTSAPMTLIVRDVPGHRFIVSRRSTTLVLRHSLDGKPSDASLPTGSRDIAAYIVATCLKNRRQDGETA